MQQSGQIIAQKLHPKQSPLSSKATGLTPFLFKVFSALMLALGQTPTQRKHPLHFSLSMVILAILQ
jgi:hypothetical protein